MFDCSKCVPAGWYNSPRQAPRNCTPVETPNGWIGTQNDDVSRPFTEDGWRFMESLPMGDGSGRRGDVARRAYIERAFPREIISSCPRHLLTAYVWQWLTLWFAHRRSDFVPHADRTTFHQVVMTALDNERGAHELAEMDAREDMRG